MTCLEIIALLPDYVRRRLPPDEAATVRAHLSACTACAAAYEEELAFGALLRGTDQAAPPEVLGWVMASVRAEPRPVPPFRLRLLDLALALGLMVVVAGFVIGLLSLWAISPVVTASIDPGALFGGWSVSTIAIAALWALVGLAVSIPIAAVMHAALGKGRRTIAGGS